MRYIAETKDKVNLDNLRNLFQFKELFQIGDETFSFTHDESDSYLLNEVLDSSDIVRVYTEESYASINKNFNKSLFENHRFRLLWYGRCNDFTNQHGDSIILKKENENWPLKRVWKNNQHTQHFVSWDSRIHPEIYQPFSSIKEGNLYFIELEGTNTPLYIKGLEDTNQHDQLGVSNCDLNSLNTDSNLKNEYNLVWFGICGDTDNLTVDLRSMENVIEAYQFSEKGVAINGVYRSTDLSQSTFTTLKYGNGYLIRLKKGKRQSIKGCAVSDHVDLHTFAPTYPLRLKNCPPKPSTMCCPDGKMSLDIKTGKVYDINYLSIMATPAGRLCWDEISEPTRPQQYTISFGESDFSKGGINISAIGNIEGKVFRYETEDGTCYEGELDYGETPIVFKEVVDPYTTPVSKPTPTPTPAKVECCEGGVMVTKGMVSGGNSDGPIGITISGFEEGGVVCVSELTSIPEQTSCVFETEGGEIAGMITLSFKPVTENIRYHSVSGKCYRGVLRDISSEPQILLEV